MCLKVVNFMKNLFNYTVPFATNLIMERFNIQHRICPSDEGKSLVHQENLRPINHLKANRTLLH